MKILIVAATEGEISHLRSISTTQQLKFLVTGVGMVSTAYALTKELNKEKFDLVINCGIAGSFDRTISIGEVVQVTEDILSELGAEDGDKFLDISEIDLPGKLSFRPTFLLSSDFFRNVKSITVNTVHGNQKNIEAIQSRIQPQIESMEGAAVFQVCESENIPCIQLRAISNYVERRNKLNWNIPLAIKNLSEGMKKFLEEISQNKKNLTLGFSPCPNDTFMFDALVNKRIDNEGFNFEVKLEDVETLNRGAMKEELDITKLSFATYSKVMDKYELLTAGSALGTGVGPLYISRKEFIDTPDKITRVAIPGKNTTANYLFKMFYPEKTETVEIVFSDIEDAILSGKVDAGVIIHENRFTFQDKGLKKISDLGELWEKKTGQPIPLGGIAVKRNLDDLTKRKINSLVKKSVEYAMAHPGDSFEYVKIHAQEMNETVRKKHIELYVNQYSIDLGETGRNSIKKFLESEVYLTKSSFRKDIFADGS